jgi:glyoxylase-like metal-dependent hydrolase (beta-lactamase superfamily II)
VALLRPTSWPWAAYALRAGLLRESNPENVIAFRDGEVLDVRGAPRVVHSPGHTRGSSSFHFSDPNVFFSGDVLVTFDPYSRARGPRVMVDGVNEDPQETRESLKKIASVDSPLVLPGHGDPWERGVASAVEHASL